MKLSYQRLHKVRFPVGLIVALCLVVLPLSHLHAQLVEGSTFVQRTDGDSVQAVLKKMNEEHPALVGYLTETERYYLIYPRKDAVPEEQLIEIQDAFFADIEALCKVYSHRYLTDWRAMASKAARESFWGTSYLCNRTFNYFGIRHKAKPWICEAFNFCQSFVRNDPHPAEFAVFPNFEASLWVFIHTIYSSHFLERLPDGGARVADAIEFERVNGIKYWEKTPYGISYGAQIPGYPYTAKQLINTWSGHEINNLCVACSRESDLKWVHKLILADVRSRK
jgi:hypothetical protein